MRVRDQVDALSFLVGELWEQARVEWLLRQERVAEVMLSRHNIHVNGLTQLIKEKLEGFHDMGNVFVNFHVEFACSVASSENLIDLLRLDHGVSCYHHSLYLRDELLAS